MVNLLLRSPRVCFFEPARQMDDNENLMRQLKPRAPSNYYYDIDDIITMQEKVPVKYELPCYRLGFLDPSTTEEHLNSGTKMEVPCWLALKLCTGQRLIASVELPKIYNASYREIFKADANVLDLHRMGPYFYRFGTRLLHFQHRDSGDVARAMLEVFVKRFRRVMDASHNASHQDVVKIKQKLDAFEVQLFDMGQAALHDHIAWLEGRVGKLTVSNSVSLQRKRKRAEMEP